MDSGRFSLPDLPLVHRLIFWGWLLSLGLVGLGSLTPRLNIPDSVPESDKVLHCLAYFWLAFWPGLSFLSLSRIWALALGLIGLGLGLELAQILVPGRYFSFLDFAANSLGVALGLLFAFGLRHLRAGSRI